MLYDTLRLNAILRLNAAYDVSLKARNSRAAYQFSHVHTHCILKLASLWRHFLLDPALSRF